MAESEQAPKDQRVCRLAKSLNGKHKKGTAALVVPFSSLNARLSDYARHSAGADFSRFT